MKKIVIVGGGFAGATLVRSLANARKAGMDVTLISEESYTTFNPMLAEVVGAAVFPEHVVAPLREFTRHARFVMGPVTNVDFAARTLNCNTLNGPLDVPYDHLVLAFGNRARLNLIPGMSEHGHVLKTIGDAMHLRNLVLRRLARMELEADSSVRRALGHFVVIGGGFSGVEVAGALVDVLSSVTHYYPLVKPDELAISLLHDGPVLLPQLPEKLGQAAANSLRARKVNVRLGSSAVQIEANRICLKDGEIIHAATAIATVGTKPNGLTQVLATLPLERGRIVCDAHCAVTGMDGVWAIGDCAQIPMPDGTSAIPTAQFAVAQAKLLAGNLRSVMQDRPVRAFSYRSRGMMATVGHHKGVADLFGLRISGLPAWLLWRAYYLGQMPTLGRKFRVFVEWTWGMFFRPDITHFRFERSVDLECPPSGQVPNKL